MHATNLYGYLEAAMRNGLASPSHPEGIRDHKTILLKMVLANGMIVEESGQNALANQLVDNVRETCDDILRGDVIDIKCVPVVTLVVC